MTYAEVQREVEKSLPQIQNEVREAFLKGAQKMDEYYGGGIRDTYNGDDETPAPKAEPVNPTPPPLPEKDYNFPDFVATTGYGNMLGLCGINCRHTFSIFFPNLMDSTPDIIDSKANKRKYKAEQEARSMERIIRKQKQKLSAFQAVSDEIGAQKKQALVDNINSLIQQYQDFCRRNDVSMTEWRLATYNSHPKFKKNNNTAQAKVNPANMSNAMKKKMEEVYKLTNGDIYNMCQTTAPSTQNTFIEACDDAFMNIQTGMPLNEAISRAIDSVADKGVTCVYYNSGRTDRIEVALARAIRTGINQANAQLILMKCAELGIDYVKVSAHYGARVTNKNDYTNHSWWQGKVYKLNWENKAISKFKDAVNAPTEEKAVNEPEMAQEYANNINENANEQYKNNRNNDIIKDKFIKGTYPVSNEMIADILSNELSGVRMSAVPKYNPRIATAGKTVVRYSPLNRPIEVAYIYIGKQVIDTREELIDTLLHEELEARNMMKHTFDEISNANDDDIHNRIDKIIKRFFLAKGLDYGKTRNGKRTI